MISFIIPPISDCFMPTLGVPQLIGYLMDKGIECRAYDISIEFIQKIQSRNFLTPYIERMKASWIGMPEEKKLLFPYLSKLLFDDDVFFKDDYSRLVARLNFLSQNDNEYRIAPDDFKSILSWQEFVNIDSQIGQDSIIRKAYEQLNTIFEIIQNQNPYLCLSISYESQMIPSLILSKMLKENMQDSKVVFGGSFFYNYGEIATNFIESIDFVDALIIGPGERPIEILAKKGTKNIRSNLKDCGIISQKLGTKLIIDSRGFKQKEFSRPNFSCFNFEKYFSNERAFPYLIRDSCYYGKCKFCNGDRNSKYINSKNIGQVIDDVNRNSSQLGVRNVYFVDAALSPKDLERIVAKQNTINFFWIANVRFEKSLSDPLFMKRIADSGCKMLRFGLESGSEYILALMNKGIQLNAASDILKCSHKEGIKNHLYIMFGYPNEKKEDRDLTIQFLYDHKEYIYSYSISFFQPIPNTPVYDEVCAEAKKKGYNDTDLNYFLYSPNDRYKKICSDVKRVNEILKNHVHTNLVFYSANIFSGINDKIRKSEENYVRLNPEMFFFSKLSLEIFQRMPNFMVELRIIQKERNESHVEFIIFDYLKNAKIYISISQSIASIFKNAYNGDVDNLVSELNPAQRNDAIELLHLLSNFSHSVEFLKPQKSYHDLDGFDLNVNISNDLKDMAIQFFLIDQES